jgi:hypothetical protein
MEAIGGEELYSCSFTTLAIDEVIFQLYAQAALYPRGKTPPLPILK